MHIYISTMEEEHSFPPFLKYGSIENSYRENILRHIAEVIDPTEEWVALEKIHGCNFSATTNGRVTKWASRSSYIGDEGLRSFNNALIATMRYEVSILNLFNKLKEEYPGLYTVRVFGELFGGTYPGKDLPHQYKAIQKGVFYTNDIEFMVFDVAISTNSIDTPEVSSIYLDTEDVINYCRKAGLVPLEILYRGTLHDMLQLNQVFQSTIPSILGLPTLDNNEAEGFVLKPKKNVESERGRIILKHKNPKYLENICEKPVKVKVSAEFTEKDEETFLLMQQYINENRFNAVMSKLSDERKSNPQAIIGITVKDAMTDIMKDMDSLVTPETKPLFQRRLVEYTKIYWDQKK